MSYTGYRTETLHMSEKDAAVVKAALALYAETCAGFALADASLRETWQETRMLADELFRRIDGEDDGHDVGWNTAADEHETWRRLVLDPSRRGY